MIFFSSFQDSSLLWDLHSLVDLRRVLDSLVCSGFFFPLVVRVEVISRLFIYWTGETSGFDLTEFGPVGIKENRIYNIFIN